VPADGATGTGTSPFPAQQPSAAAAASQPLPTGPVDYVPGPPVTAPSRAPGGASAVPPDLLHDLDDEPRRPRDLRRLAGGVLAVAALVLLEVGLLVHESGENLWSRVPLWSAFASLACVIGLAVLAARLPGARGAAAHAWTIAAGGLAGVAVFWLLVVLPSAGSDRGFLLTAALGCLGAATWLGGRG
jgi:hypothetical protein